LLTQKITYQDIKGTYKKTDEKKLYVSLNCQLLLALLTQPLF